MSVSQMSFDQKSWNVPEIKFAYQTEIFIHRSFFILIHAKILAEAINNFKAVIRILALVSKFVTDLH